MEPDRSDEGRLRTLDVKIARRRRTSRARPAIVALLIGLGSLAGQALAARLLASWAAASPSGWIPLYLLGRQLLGASEFRGGRQPARSRSLAARIEDRAGGGRVEAASDGGRLRATP